MNRALELRTFGGRDWLWGAAWGGGGVEVHSFRGTRYTEQGMCQALLVVTQPYFKRCLVAEILAADRPAESPALTVSLQESLG